MKISRRNFMQIFAGTTAMALVPSIFLNGVEEVDIDQLEYRLEPDPSEDYSTHWAASGSVLKGPARLYDLMAIDMEGKLRLRRSQGTTPILEWIMHKNMTFRWVAAPGQEIWVPKGQSILIDHPDIKDLVDQAFWMHYERPNSEGKYVSKPVTLTGDEDSEDWDSFEADVEDYGGHDMTEDS